MPRKINVAVAAALIATSASTALTESATAKPAHHALPIFSAGRNAAVPAPFTDAERDWFARTSRPSNL